MVFALHETKSQEPEQYSMRFREHAAVQSKNDYFMVDPRKLKIDENYNCRDMQSKDTREHIAALKSSIVVNGVKVPLEVRMDDHDRIYIVAGHCRHAAVMEAIKDGAEIVAVPCMLEPARTSEADRAVNLIVSNSGKPLAPLEIAAVVKRLVNFGWKEKDIAERLGWKSTNTVKQHLDLLALPEPVKEHVRAGNVSATTARQIAKGVDPVEAEKMIQANLEENRRIKGTRQRSTKVTRKTIARDKPKAKPQEAKSDSATPPQAPAPITEQQVIEGLQARGYHVIKDDGDAATDLPSALAAPLNQIPQPDATIAIWIELTKQAHLILQHNQSDDHPGYWTPAFRDAIRKARDAIERLTGSPLEFETLPDPHSQDEAA